MRLTSMHEERGNGQWKGFILMILMIMWLAGMLHRRESATAFIHPNPVLRAATEALGTDRHQFVLISRKTYTGKVEQS